MFCIKLGKKMNLFIFIIYHFSYNVKVKRGNFFKLEPRPMKYFIKDDALFEP